MRVCEICKKELEKNMICIQINVFGNIRAISLGSVDRELDFCYEHGIKVLDEIMKVRELLL